MADNFHRFARRENPGSGATLPIHRALIRCPHSPAKPRARCANIRSMFSAQSHQTSPGVSTRCSETQVRTLRICRGLQKKFLPIWITGASDEERCDCKRRRIQAASNIVVFPSPFAPRNKFKAGPISIDTPSKQRKLRKRKFVSI